MRSKRPLIAWLLALVVLAGACTTRAPARTPAPAPTTSDPSPAPSMLKIAFIEDLAPEDAQTRTAPAYQGARLAVDTATLGERLPVPVEIVALDTKGDPSTAADVVRTIVDDQSFVGAIGAPLLTGQASIGVAMDAAGLPMITLSTLGPDLSRNGWTGWRRAVAGQTREAAVLADHIDGMRRLGAGACLIGDGSPASIGLLHGVARAISTPVALRMRAAIERNGSDRVVAAIAAAGCGVVVWGGFGAEGAVLRQQLVEQGLRSVRFVGGEGLKDPTFLSVVGEAGAGTVVVCPCVDLTTSTRFAAQRFIQDYQSDFGLPPGPYAAEAWDVMRMFLQAIERGAATRSQVAAALSATSSFEGLADTYVFEPSGELVPSSAQVHVFRDEGGRWIPQTG
ncbi:MAG TPA: branched-chain amino acid ABC transporter substrate-binding protein [Actinomycetota bacterium]|jgi:branched-chain amino acid transport system substrate-binding protein|nr:branched-chain amino acid ABC transporter substrate-binding protein [Actinomycetota bacterium]